MTGKNPLTTDLIPVFKENPLYRTSLLFFSSVENVHHRARSDARKRVYTPSCSNVRERALVIDFNKRENERMEEREPKESMKERRKGETEER